MRDLYDREAARYDSIVRITERLLFADGRIWAAAHAVGDVLEIAVGTARNLPHYRSEVRLTGLDISPAMLAIARRRAQALGRAADLRVAMHSTSHNEGARNGVSPFQDAALARS